MWSLRVFVFLGKQKAAWGMRTCLEFRLVLSADPGLEVGLYVTTDLQTMTRVWMGDLAMKSAIASGRIELDGARELRQRLERWLGLSGFAGIADAKRPTHTSRNRDRSDRRHSMHLV